MARKELVVEFSPGTGPFDTPTWIELTAGGPHGNRVRSAEWTWGRQSDDRDWPPGQATIVLTNHDRMFDPDNTSGTYSGDLLPRVPFRLTTDAGEDLFYGFVEEGWEQTYGHPVDGYCTVRLVDMLTVLDGVTLPSVLAAEIMADNPVAYWPLDEEVGVAMRDATGTHPDGEYVHGTTDLAAQVGTAAGGKVTGLALDGEHFGWIRDMATTVHDRPCCIEMVFKVGDTPATQFPFRSGTGNPDGGNTVQLNGGATTWSITSATRDGDANGLCNTNTHNNLGEGGAVHHFVHQRPASGDAAVWLDGEDDTALTATVPTTGVAAAPGTVIGAADYQSGQRISTARTFRGFLGHVAVYDTDLGSTRIAAHATAALAPLAGLRSDEQIQWALDQAAVPASLITLDVGRTLMGPADTAGRKVIDFIADVARTEHGAFYVDHHDGGKLRFTERYTPWLATRSTSAQATFSDDPANTTAVRVEPGSLVVEPNGIRTVTNQATVRWAGGEETAEDATSVAAYGPRGKSITTLAGNPNQALSLAQWIAFLNAEPATRIRGFRLRPAGAEAGFPVAVDLRPHDLVQFRSQPSSTGSVVTRDLLVEGVSHKVDDLDWETTFYTSTTPADGIDLFILGTSLLDGTDVLAY